MSIYSKINNKFITVTAIKYKEGVPLEEIYNSLIRMRDYD